MWTPPSKDIERTSNITCLTVNDFGETPEALQNLLKLPRALESFNYGRIYSNPSRWTLNMFQGLLAGHQTTLKRIEIGALGRGYTPINFLEFPQLEILHLSHWVYKESSEVAAASILSPKLHTFIWDFRVMDQHSESWSDFGEEQKEWVLRFAELAAGRRSVLRKIEIMFYPDGDYNEPRAREELATCVTPWDLMDEVKEKIKPLGIELEYNKCWSREECLRNIELKEKSSEQRLENVEVEESSSILNE
ncbi:hypothetical protein EG329_003178 [Mollisiaceae sp. DMI_Dod_QoI]|nr:hypothetical protein EG329_003178 [Helotiales sp. DMI_Dod_QoI]